MHNEICVRIYGYDYEKMLISFISKLNLSEPRLLKLFNDFFQNEEKVPVSSSDRPGASMCSYSES